MTSLRIVIADDESVICMDLREALAALGHQVVGEAANGEEALRLIRQEKPDLAILDIRMPKLDGIKVAETASAEKLCAIILLTAYSQRDLAHRAQRAGVFAYLVKPFKEADLLPAIEIARARHQELLALQDQVLSLEERLETRKLLDRAKGLLMKYHRLSEPEAFRSLQRESMQARKPLREVAEAVIASLRRFEKPTLQ
jgi:response regulator NasT